jgi:hypothetical protein
MREDRIALTPVTQQTMNPQTTAETIADGNTIRAIHQRMIPSADIRHPHERNAPSARGEVRVLPERRARRDALRHLPKT